jgi:crossover junction endodeoxyribonuclease RuvC
MISVGLDLSLTKTGFAIVDDKGTVLSSGIIKSKPVGDHPIDEIRRIVKIAEDVMQTIDETLPNVDPSIVCIEGLAFSVRNTSSLVQLAGLNYLTRILLNQFKWNFVIICPTTLKKFITGSGKGDKDMMMLAVYKNYGHEAIDNNENDAYALSVCGLALLGKPLKKMIKPQEEVIQLLKKQL